MTQVLQNEPNPDREYKSRLFAMVFSQKKELLELYNAMNGTSYDNPELLEINTLENAIYLAMHNDISFLINSRMSLYEHQSTYNPNIPLRFLEYTADLYSGITKDKNLYGTKLVKIPAPEFVVFYNGLTDKPDMMELKLSDAYETREKELHLELKVRMLNVNKGHNRQLLDACKTLKDYAEYTDRVRQYAKSVSIESAVERAITECIKEGILAEFLSRNRAEAKKVSIYEYDQEKHMWMEREENFEEGRLDGYQEKLISQVCKKLQKNHSIPEIADMLEESEKEVQRICDIAKKYAPGYDVEKILKELKIEKNER